MSTTIYPALTLTTIDQLATGDWAFAKERTGESSYVLVMKTDKPCSNENETARWLLVIGQGTAGFYCSTQLQPRALGLDGEIRIPVPIEHQQPETGHTYKPGFLYSALSDEGLHLVAQLRRHYGAASVQIDGKGMESEIPDRADLWRASMIQYRNPGDTTWYELANVDAPLET